MDHIGEGNKMVDGTLTEARRLVAAGLTLRHRIRRVLQEMKGHECRSPCPWCEVERELLAASWDDAYVLRVGGSIDFEELPHD